MGRTHVRKFTDPRVLQHLECGSRSTNCGHYSRREAPATLHPLAENARLLCMKWLWRVVWVVWGREAACNSRSSLRLARWQLQNVGSRPRETAIVSRVTRGWGEGGGDPAYLEGIVRDVIRTIDPLAHRLLFIVEISEDKKAVVSCLYLVILNRFITNWSPLLMPLYLFSLLGLSYFVYVWLYFIKRMSIIIVTP